MEQNNTNWMPIKAHPYDHQQKAYEFVCSSFGLTGRNPPPSRGVALLMEMGTGKSLTSIAIVGQLWKERRIRRVLIVAPLSILGVWEEEFQKFAAFGYELTILTGSLAHKAETIRSASSPSRVSRNFSAVSI